MLRKTLYFFALSLCLGVTFQGCSATKTTNTSRSAVEQLLVSNAVDQSLNKVDFSPFSGHTVFLEDKYVECVDKNYVISSVRHRIMASGALLVDSRDKAEIAVELRTGTVGTDTADAFLGIPEITLPGMLTLPEVRLLSRSVQTGTAKIGLVAMDTQSLEVLGGGGMTLARSNDENWFVAGMGPFKTGSVQQEVSSGTSGQAAIWRNNVSNTVVFDTPRKSVPRPGEESDEMHYTSTTSLVDELPLPR